MASSPWSWTWPCNLRAPPQSMSPPSWVCRTCISWALQGRPCRSSPPTPRRWATWHWGETMEYHSAVNFQRFGEENVLVWFCWIFFDFMKVCPKNRSYLCPKYRKSVSIHVAKWWSRQTYQGNQPWTNPQWIGSSENMHGINFFYTREFRLSCRSQATVPSHGCLRLCGALGGRRFGWPPGLCWIYPADEGHGGLKCHVPCRRCWYGFNDVYGSVQKWGTYNNTNISKNRWFLHAYITACIMFLFLIGILWSTINFGYFWVLGHMGSELCHDDSDADDDGTC